MVATDAFFGNALTGDVSSRISCLKQNKKNIYTSIWLARKLGGFLASHTFLIKKDANEKSHWDPKVYIKPKTKQKWFFFILDA